MLARPLIPSSRPVVPRRLSGFTLIELLVVIGIIIVLIGILIPVVSRVRIASQKADTQSWMNQLGSAIERYQQDFHAYPGPLANNEMDLGDTSVTYPPSPFTAFALKSTAPGYDTSEGSAQAAKNFTMSENLVLGLLGGLHLDPTTTTQLDYDPSAVGGGPASLSLIGLPKRYTPYLDTKQLSWQTNSNGISGHYFDGSGAANDSIIPCFLDRFNDQMPILYLRAKVGASPASASDASNPIITDDLTEAQSTPRPGQYDISQIIAYTGAYTGSWPGLTRDTATPPTGSSIGVGKSARASDYTAPPSGNQLYHGLQMFTWTAPNYPTMVKPAVNAHPYQYPYDAYPYLLGSSGQVREKDAYILISAGADRVYGTDDDLCNFGTVGQ